jgi:dipeptidase E
MSKIILTSSFSTVAKELYAKGILPNEIKRVAFIPTAGDLYTSKPWMEADRKALSDFGYVVSDVDLKEKHASELFDELTTFDIIFVAGGNTTYLFEYAHVSGFVTIINNLLTRGCIYIGSSAGSLLAGPSVEPFVEDDLSELPKDFALHNSDGLNLVDYIILPHYPNFGESNDRIAEKYVARYDFIKMTDCEYRIEEI